MSTSQPWPAEARAAVERVVHEQVPTLTRGPIGTEFVTDAILDTLAPFLAAAQAEAAAAASDPLRNAPGMLDVHLPAADLDAAEAHAEQQAQQLAARLNAAAAHVELTHADRVRAALKAGRRYPRTAEEPRP